MKDTSNYSHSSRIRQSVTFTVLCMFSFTQLSYKQEWYIHCIDKLTLNFLYSHLNLIFWLSCTGLMESHWKTHFHNIQCYCIASLQCTHTHLMCVFHIFLWGSGNLWAIPVAVFHLRLSVMCLGPSWKLYSTLKNSKPLSDNGWICVYIELVYQIMSC